MLLVRYRRQQFLIGQEFEEKQEASGSIGALALPFEDLLKQTENELQGPSVGK